AAELNLSPQRKREKLFEAFLNQLEAEAQHRPVLMVFEDAHWIDPTSRELLDVTVDGCGGCRCCSRSPSVRNFSRPGVVAPTSRVWRSIGSANETARRWCKLWPAMPRSPPISSPRSSSAPTGCRSLSRS